MKQQNTFFAALIRYHSKFTFVTWICLVFAISGLACLAIAAQMIRIEWLYRSVARKTQGTVIRKFRSSSSGSFGGTGSSRGASGGGTNYVVEYEYNSASGQVFLDSDRVSERYWTILRPGQPLQVFYLPERGGHSRLWLGIRLFDPVIFLLVGLLSSVMGVGAACMVVSDRRNKDHRRRHASIGRHGLGVSKQL